MFMITFRAYTDKHKPSVHPASTKIEGTKLRECRVKKGENFLDVGKKYHRDFFFAFNSI